MHNTRGKTEFPDGPIHFLHVAKAAGTQIGYVIDQVNQSRSQRKLIRHGHEIRLADIPDDQDYFFSTRDPIARFKSGFYSRLRKGQPRLNAEWSEHERLAFTRFPHANDLAEALFAPDSLGHDATAAIRSIRHCSRNLVDWFSFHGHLFELRPPIWIIRQEHLSTDLGTFLTLIGHQAPVQIANRERLSHANNYRGVPELSDKAKANLRSWYAQDYAFLSLCEAWMKNAGSTSTI